MGDLTIWMILGFLLASYSIIGNDSVQTLGTFIASNKKIKWWVLWIFASTILVATLVYSWWSTGGDISFGRLTKIPFVEVQWYHAAAPLFLVLLTRLGIPVSTSLLVLSAFASSLVFEKILAKSAIGYVLSAILAYTLWIIISRWDSKKNPIAPENKIKWRIFQWFSTGFLWFSWLSHDIANVAIFLPRNIDAPTLVLVLLVFIIGLAHIFSTQGGKIQNIVLSKENTSYVRSATLIDLFYAFMLIFFKQYNDIPMSTTWVFVGMLCGRELAIATMQKGIHKIKDVFPIVGKDILKLLFGLFVSVVIALLIQNIDQVDEIFAGIF
jgi:phosphate/sulfate permease